MHAEPILAQRTSWTSQGNRWTGLRVRLQLDQWVLPTSLPTSLPSSLPTSPTTSLPTSLVNLFSYDVPVSYAISEQMIRTPWRSMPR